MTQTPVVIIGDSLSGLACAACLQKQSIPYIILEKEKQIATPWRNHYYRLHLHTARSLSHLPYKKFNSNISRYPSRQEVVDYVDDYRQSFGIESCFDTEAISLKRENNSWITETNTGAFQSRCGNIE